MTYYIKEFSYPTDGKNSLLLKNQKLMHPQSQEVLMKRRTFIRERMLFPLVLLVVMAVLSVTFVSCMPDLPSEDDVVITPPIPDPLPNDK